jgi:DNA-binding LacI/PurR family transcriptional regulator
MGISTKKPKYQQVADALRLQIEQGQLKPGDRLPSINELTAHYGISLHTVGKVHDALGADGLIRRDRGRGVFVDAKPKNTATGFLAYFSHNYGLVKNLAFHAVIQQSIRQATHEAGKYLTIVEEPKDFPHWSLMEGLLISDMGHYDRKQLKALLPANLPCLNIMFNDPGIHSVMADDADGMRQAVEALIAAGHQRIGYLSHLQHVILQERHGAYLTTMQSHGLPVRADWVYCKVPPRYPSYREYGYHAMQQWLGDGWEELKLTAMLAHNDSAALGMIEALAEHGISVPEDISIVGFDGIAENVVSSVELSTVRVPLQEIGQTAIQVLLDQQKAQSSQRITVQLATHFQAGNTIRRIA